ncbi:MAG: membrane-bound serine protease (ClpP class) [Candidatus Magnetoglobus multicellularis str. Araruama]|uniref:Membrane-bound serine protease (ClpP class) n=1 Tax=Candidatus Magnetoglobus multicellularis str. Araruama TaxID=890399 RepID=A0A1V1P8X8_9BACT|nr:MAG: membrane-bound serine protease (ClpP class) [Candidatus Magnetoglobus multicellularis str. Araruama]
MNDILFAILMQLAAGIVVLAEIFIPSGGILGAIATGLFGYSLFLLYSSVSVIAGSFALCIDLIFVPLIVFWGFKRLGQSKLTLNTSLSREQGVVSQSKELEKLIGLTGMALSTLRPSGCAEINNLRVDVVTRGEFIEKGTPIEVTAVTGNQVIVDPSETEKAITIPEKNIDL